MASREVVAALRHVPALSNVSLGAVANSKGGPIRTQARKSVRRQATISSQSVMRKNLPVFPHRRVGFADAAALFPAVWINEIPLPATLGSQPTTSGTAGINPA